MLGRRGGWVEFGKLKDQGKMRGESQSERNEDTGAVVIEKKVRETSKERQRDRGRDGETEMTVKARERGEREGSERGEERQSNTGHKK